MPEVILSLTHDSLMELLHGLTDNDLQYLANRLADKFQPHAQETYTIAELSEKLKLSRDTITDRIHKGEFGDVIRDGRRYPRRQTVPRDRRRFAAVHRPAQRASVSQAGAAADAVQTETR